MSRYRWAQAALPHVRSAEDAERVRRVLLEGQYAMDRARAVIDGREAPPPSEELRWPGTHQEPPVELDSRGRPRYVGYDGGWYGGWGSGGGLLGVGGGLLGGLVLGQMLDGFGREHHHDGRWFGGWWRRLGR